MRTFLLYISPDLHVFRPKKCDLAHISPPMLSLYCDRMDRKDYKMDDYLDRDAPLSESSVSMKLSLIQKRCGQLMDESDGLELALEEPAPQIEENDPYNQQ